MKDTRVGSGKYSSYSYITTKISLTFVNHDEDN